MEGIDFTTSNALAGSSNNTDDNDAKFQTVKNYSSIKKEKCDVKKKFQSQGRTPARLIQATSPVFLPVKPAQSPDALNNEAKKSHEAITDDHRRSGRYGNG
ncbi:hypothetical protein RIR_jg29768.t1 [Rhizophagus irregularis DAOM 181602=DAOM 197198]|nr:hypothetical protein RIR_jg29768.t1 [Rhizophagus irregularis DAOM 181602=DAOM 197198]CAG8698722.1 22401_t:CDS:2 [Rhizophagus irregularis]